MCIAVKLKLKIQEPFFRNLRRKRISDKNDGAIETFNQMPV